MSEEQADLGLAYREAEGIRRQIDTGELQPGDAIPTLAAMIDRGVSVTTARAARQLLREWGLVSGGRGAPLRVRRRDRQILRSNSRHQLEKDRVSLSEQERRELGTTELELGMSIGDTDFHAHYSRIAASPELAELFDVEAGAALLQRNYETRYLESGRLAAQSVSYIPVELIERNPELLDERSEPWPGGTQHQLSTVGIELGEIVDRATARPPIAGERAAWGMEPGDVLLVVRRLAIDVAGRVVEVSDTLFPAGWTVLETRTELRRWPAEPANDH